MSRTSLRRRVAMLREFALLCLDFAPEMRTVGKYSAPQREAGERFFDETARQASQEADDLEKRIWRTSAA